MGLTAKVRTSLSIQCSWTIGPTGSPLLSHAGMTLRYALRNSEGRLTTPVGKTRISHVEAPHTLHLRSHLGSHLPRKGRCVMLRASVASPEVTGAFPRSVAKHLGTSLGGLGVQTATVELPSQGHAHRQSR